MQEKKIHVSVVRENYEMKLPAEWMDDKLSVFESNSQVHKAVFALLSEWRAVAITGAMPAGIVNWLAAYMRAYSNAKPTEFSRHASAQLINQRILEEAPELAVNEKLFEKITNSVRQVTFEVGSTAAQVEIDVNRDVLWNAMLDGDLSFPMMLYSSQRVCFLGYYNAYECFLVDVLKELSGLESVRMNDKKKVNPLIKKHFGGNVGFDKCWGNTELNIARLARHSFSHAGGKLTAELNKIKHGLEVIEGVIQVPVEFNIKLLDTLRAGVDYVCSHLGAASKS